MYLDDRKLQVRMGLVLSGGGAKGAYQAGVFSALWELGVYGKVEAVSGSSIGALNALLFAMADPGTWEKAWQEASYQRFFSGEESVVKSRMSTVFQDLMSAARGSSLGEFLGTQQLSLFSQDSLRGYVREFVDPAKLAAAPQELFVCAYNLEQNRPEYFSLRGRPFRDVVELTMASSCIPVVFPTVSFGGNHYCDGGITPPYSTLDNADKVPLAPLAGLGLDVVVVSYLTHYDKVDPALLGGRTRLLELYPSRPLEVIPGSGTMDMTKETIRGHMELGRQDTLAAFAPFLAGLLRGRPLEEVLEEHNARNQRLLLGEQAKNEEVAREARQVSDRLRHFGEKLLHPGPAAN